MSAYGLGHVQSGVCPGTSPLQSIELVDGKCPACHARPMSFRALAVAGRYEGVLRQAVLRWKFSGRWALDKLLASMQAAALARCPWSDRIDALVPIAQPWTRWLVRRSHPAGELAARLSRHTGLPVWPVLRARPHRPQVGLSIAVRKGNVRSVFRVARKAHLAGCRLCLVDDVVTTGATLHAAARALLRAGVSDVYAVTVARTP